MLTNGGRSSAEEKTAAANKRSTSERRKRLAALLASYGAATAGLALGGGEAEATPIGNAGTPATLPVVANPFATQPASPLLLDIDGDGANDFAVYQSAAPFPGSGTMRWFVKGLAAGNRIFATATNSNALAEAYLSAQDAIAMAAAAPPSSLAPRALLMGVIVSRTQTGYTYTNVGSSYSVYVPFYQYVVRNSHLFGNFWLNGSPTNYIGLRFQIGGVEHTGFAGFTVRTDAVAPSEFELTLHGYGYEPSNSVGTTEVPEPSALGLLALGAVGVLEARRRRRRTTG